MAVDARAPRISQRGGFPDCLRLPLRFLLLVVMALSSRSAAAVIESTGSRSRKVRSQAPFLHHASADTDSGCAACRCRLRGANRRQAMAQPVHTSTVTPAEAMPASV